MTHSAEQPVEFDIDAARAYNNVSNAKMSASRPASSGGRRPAPGE